MTAASGSAEVLHIHVREFGAGHTPALLLHCGQGRGGMWRGVAQHLHDRYAMTAPDFPGHGRSDPWPAGQDVHDVATDAVEPFVRDGAHVIGHSFGATVALRLALRRPDRVARLVLIEPVLFAAARNSPEAALQQQADAAFTAACKAGDMAAAARAFNRQWGAGQRWDDLRDDTRAAMARSIPFILASEPALRDDRARLLAPGGLELLPMPVTLVRGARTQPVVAAIHRALAKRIPDASETVIPGAGHMVPITHPDAVAKAIVG
ncbi:alpha/beta fold hydrolase [Citreimonas salinaria]|uniref:Pimeloyl-ACP methyl ester carboxylesterase n=1 Tax=Citreimonas salinaria TaxID=321339 RepID=A0A1H3HRL7_9RHOB|nr:alpha/beta hydrolase [Citreimonas salinaria]SDY17319.1 Pimeloyl-ACP methyl ester carboxylesterase [Citreimonas salinaria]